MAIVEFKFSDNVQPSGLTERLPPGVYKMVIKSVKDVTRKTKEGEEYLQAEIALSVDPSEGVKGNTKLYLSYPNPEDPEGGSAAGWLALWMWVTKKSAAETRAYLNTKKMDWAAKLNTSKAVIGINVYETTYQDKKTGEDKKGLRSWPLSPDDYKEAKANDKAPAGGAKTKGKSAVADEDDFDTGTKNKNSAASEESDDDFDI